MKTRDGIRFINKFHIEIERGGKVVSEFDVENQVVTVGANSLLGVGFHADTQITAWYIGLIDNAGYSAIANADTLASHAGWAETTAYTGNRPAWGPDASSARAISNGTLVLFNINATKTLKGIFVASVNTGTAGTLWSAAAFLATQAVANGDVVRVTYTVSIA